MYLDWVILSVLEPIRQPFLTNFFALIYYLTYPLYFSLLLYHFKKENYRKLIHFIVNTLVGVAIVYFLKFAIGRERPVISLIKKQEWSFPSNHTFIAFLSLKFLVENKYLKKLYQLYFVFLLPFSLLYLAVHYPSDILFSAFFASFLPYLLNEKMSYKIFRLAVSKLSKLKIF